MSISKRLLTPLLFLAATAACESDPEMTPSDAGSTPAPDAGTSSVDVGRDASAPAEDVGAVRTFIERRMFGDGPVSNLVFDPLFDLSAYHWVAFSTESAVLIEKHILAVTPTHQPAIRVQQDAVGQGAYVLGSAASIQGSLEASVWIGHAKADVSLAPTLSASLIAMGSDGLEVAFDLVPNSISRFEGDGVVWLRYSGWITDAVGLLTLLVGAEEQASFWVTAPAVIPVHARARSNEPRLPAARDPSERERDLLAAFEAAKKHRDDPRRRARRRPGPGLVPGVHGSAVRMKMGW